MTEPIIEPPLDAYKTAKPGEPTWSVQGGDPLGAPLLRVWAAFARLMAGVITPGVLDGIFAELRMAANENRSDSERECAALLLRATETEKVSWQMDRYRKTGQVEEVHEEVDTHLDEFARIDLHDLKVRIAGRMSNFRCEIIELQEALDAKGFNDPESYNQMSIVAERLKELNEAIEPRRIFRKE